MSLANQSHKIRVVSHNVISHVLRSNPLVDLGKVL